MMERYLGAGFLLPVIEPDNNLWFTSGKLHVQFCNHCNTARFPPEDVCFSCQGLDLSMRPISGEGTIESVVEVQHPVHPLLADRVPYNVAVIALEGADGCNAIGNIVNAHAKEIEIGKKVKAVFEPASHPDTGEEMLIPNWELV